MTSVVIDPASATPRRPTDSARLCSHHTADPPIRPIVSTMVSLNPIRLCAEQALHRGLAVVAFLLLVSCIQVEQIQAQPPKEAQAEPLPQASDPDSTTNSGTSTQPQSSNAPGAANPNNTVPNDIIVDRSFAQHGAMFNQLDGPPQPRGFDFPGWGTTFRLGHLTGRAVGRKESITHLGAMPYAIHGNTGFYAEGQAYRANGGDLLWGGMVGGGVRQYIPMLDRIFGAGVFWSRDDLSNVSFTQVVASAETMGEFFDARANVYLPSGDRTGVAGINIIQESARFLENILQFDRFRTVVTSLQGADYEVVVPLPGPLGENLDLRMAAGGYYFDGPEVEDVLGWKARLEATMFNMVDVQLQVTDDQTFSTTVMFGASISLGGVPRSERRGGQFHRMSEWGKRMPHGVVSRTSVRDVALTAINPADGDPYFFYHVASDAAAGGNGALESPFQTIVQAQDAIDATMDPVDFAIVHANSTYTTPVTLRPGNNILGQGVGANHNIAIAGFPEPLVLPEVRPGTRPTLQLLGQTVDGVTMANNSEFSGFIIDHPDGNGIVIRNLTGFGTAQFNVVQNASLDGILIERSTGRYGFVDTVVEYVDDGTLPGGRLSTDVRGFHVDGGGPTAFFTSSSFIQDPSIGRLSYSLDNHGPIVLIENGVGGSVNLNGATIDDQPSDIATTPAAPGGQGVQILATSTNVTAGDMNILNSTTTGINIQDTTGRVSIRNSIRGTTAINNAAGISVNVQNTQNVVSFTGLNNSAALNITGRNDMGINVYDLGGQTGVGFAIFNDAVIVDTPNSGTATGINIQRMTDQSVVTFESSVSVADSLGIGFNIGGDDVFTDATRGFFPFAPNAAGSSVAVKGATSITNPAGSGLRIANDQSTVSLQDVSVGSRNGIGIELIGQPDAAGFALPIPHGAVSMLGTVTVDNPNGIAQPAIDIRNSTGKYQFGIPGRSGLVNITAATGGVNGTFDFGAGVNITDNSDGPDPLNITDDFEVVFNQLNVISTAGVGLYIDNDDFYDGNRAVVFPNALFPNATTNSNAFVRVHSGAFTATGDAAVEAIDSGIDITLSSVTATGGQRAIALVDTHFVRLPSTNNDNFNFEISGAGGANSGGSIQTQTVDGVFAQTQLDGSAVQSSTNRLDIYLNDRLAPRVGLRFVNFAGSPTGGTDAIDVDNIQQLFVDSSVFGSWADHSVESLNTIQMQIANSTFDDLNLAANAVPTIFHTVSRFAPTGQVYTVTINDNDITDRTNHAIDIRTVAPVNTGAGPRIDVAITNNDRIRVTDDGVQSNGVNIIWNGILNATIASNGSTPPIGITEAGFVMGINSDTNGDAGIGNFGINIQTVNTDDLATVRVNNNFFVNNASGNSAAVFTTQSPAFITVDDNRVDYQPTGVTSAIQDGFGTAYRFNMTNTARDDIIFNDNLISDNSRTFFGSGVTGLQFQQVTNAFVEINNNLMQRTTIDQFGPGGITQGIVFTTVNGTVNLFGTENNVIDGINPFQPIFNPGNFIGTTLVNGVPSPQ